MFKFLILFIKGIFVGVANIIPGVSGGTIAVVLGIFDEMITAINTIFKNFKKNVAFLLPLFIGAGAGIVLFSKLLKYCLGVYSFPTSMFFVGLVVGSIPLIYKRAKEKKVDYKCYISAIIGFLVVVAFSLLSGNDSKTISDIGTIDTMMFIKILISGIIASAAMVVPGISGSFVLVLLGMYNLVLTTISSFSSLISSNIKGISENGFGTVLNNVVTSKEFIIIITLFVGIVIGVVLISKVIQFLFEKAYSITYFAILGLIFGSIYSIFSDSLTYQSYTAENPLGIITVIIGIAVLVVGTIISLLLGKEWYVNHQKKFQKI